MSAKSASMVLQAQRKVSTIHLSPICCASAGDSSDRAEKEDAEGDDGRKTLADLMQPGPKKSRNSSAFKACQAALYARTPDVGLAIKLSQAQRISKSVR